MRRLIAPLVVLSVVALVAVACGGNSAQTTTTTAAPETTAEAASTTTTAAATTTTEATTATTQSAFYKTYKGTGGKIINLGTEPNGNYYIIHLACKGDDLTDVVKLFDANGQETSGFAAFSTMDLKAYDGRVLISPDVVKMQINKVTTWTVEVQPLSTAKPFPTPGTVAGKGDEVFNLTGNPSAMNISINTTSDYFPHIQIYFYQGGDTSGFPDQLASEMMKGFEGVAVVSWSWLGDRAISGRDLEAHLV